MELPTVYFLSGLGANASTFSRLALDWCQPRFVHWLPVQPGDTMGSYAERLFQRSIATENAWIVGLSFGGMLATEMARTHPGTKVMILSSNKQASELPWWLRSGKYLPLYRLKRSSGGPFARQVLNRFLSPATEEIAQSMMAIARQTDPALTNRFIDLIMQWRQQSPPPNLHHVHGDADRLLPLRCVKPPVQVLAGGSHLMIMNQANEVSALIRDYFAPPSA